MNINQLMNTTMKTLSALLIISLVWACQDQTANQGETAEIPFINPPFSDLNPSFKTYTIRAEDGGTVRHASGSRLLIPANAFIDAAGNVVKGEVTFNYRELHNGVDIYLAGIPMRYGNGNFQTAGFFEIRAQQKGKDLALQVAQKIQVQLASYQAGQDYQFYYLDEQARTWDSLGTSEPEINIERQALEEKVSMMRPGRKFPLDRAYFAFSYKGIIDVYYNNDLVNVNHNYMQRKLERYGLGWTDVEVYESIEWKKKKELATLMVWKNVSRKSFPKWAKKRRATLESIKKNRYRLKIVSADSTQVFSTQVEAVMPLKALFAYGPGYWKNNYEAAERKIEKAYAQMTSMAEVYRNFEIGKMGVYNWDKVIKEAEVLTLAATFDFDSLKLEANPLIAEEVVYVTGDNAGYIRIPRKEWANFKLIPDQKARLFSVLPDRRVAIYPADKLAEIELDDLRNMPNPAYVFDMEVSETALESADQLKNWLGINP